MKITCKLRPLSRAVSFLIVVACLSAMPSFLDAQDDKKSVSAAEDKKPLEVEPYTVIVTAPKEAEPALSLPLSVTADTETTIKDADLLEMKQAVVYAPNVFLNEFTARALSNPFFRGVGGSPTNPGVSTLIDGVPQLNSYSSNLELIDVSQIEFVRGPEGTLYGRNTAGGLINITSRSLSDAWVGELQGEFGNYDLRDVRGSVSSPLLADRVGFSLAGGYSARDGYTVNDYTGHDLDSREAGFGKGQFFMKPSDRLRIRLIVSGERDRDGDYALGDLFYIREHPNHVSRDFEGFNHRSVGSTTLLADYRGNAVDFSSITGGVWWRNHGLTDLDYQVATMQNGGLYATRDDVEQQYQFTQEFRLASNKDKPVNLGDALNLHWQVGAFFFKQDYQQQAANDISSIFGFFPTNLSTSSADLNDWGVGVYGQAKFTAWKKLDLTAGLRFDYEDKRADLESLNTSAEDLADNYSEISPRFSLDYRFTDDQMTYVTISRGYKAGGFNPPPTGVPAPTATQSYGTEHTWNYELGYKGKWLKDRLQTTLAFFYIDWRNLQLNQQIPYSGGQYYIGNAGAAVSKGIEVEARYHPFAWWELFGMVGYTDAKFLAGSSSFNANLGVNQAIGGRTLPYTPTFTANMGTEVSWAPVRQARLYLRLEVSTIGDFQYDASNAEGQAQYELTRMRGGVRGKHWFAEGWVDNAFNTAYVPIAIPYAQLGAPSGYVGESGAPRTYGARAGASF